MVLLLSNYFQCRSKSLNMIRPTIYLQMIICYIGLILIANSLPQPQSVNIMPEQFVGKWKVMTFHLNGLTDISTDVYHFKYHAAPSMIGNTHAFQWEIEGETLTIDNGKGEKTWQIISKRPNQLILEHQASFSKMVLERLPVSMHPKLVIN